MAEKEKRRATTFRTSKGTIVNVQYPDIYVSPAFISTEDVTNPTELREALREELKLSPLLPSLKDLGMISPHGARYQGNPVLTGGGAGAWDWSALDPWVIYNTELKRWEMWYTGQAIVAGVTREQIGRATSPDGITWTKDIGNPVLTLGAPGSWDRQDIEEPMVYVVAPDEYKMLYQGRKQIGGVYTSQIGLAESADGITWTKYAGNPVLPAPDGYYWDVRSLWRDKDGVYHLVSAYSNQNVTYPAYRAVLRHATSLDFKIWVIDSEQITLGDLVRGTYRNGVDDSHIVPFGELLLLFACTFIYESNQSIDLFLGADWRKFTYVGTCLYPYERVSAGIGGYGYHEPCVVAGPMNDLRIYYADQTTGGLDNINFAYLMLGRRRSYMLLTAASIAATASSLITSCTEVPLFGVEKLALTVRATFHASGTANLRVHMRTTPLVDYDTEDLDYFDLTVSAGNTVQKTVYVDSDAKFLKIVAENLDLAQAITNVTVTATLGGVT